MSLPAAFYRNRCVFIPEDLRKFVSKRSCRK
jgi:hypothetical protein